MLRKAFDAVREFHYSKGISPYAGEMPDTNLMKTQLDMGQAMCIRKMFDALQALKSAAADLEPWLKYSDDPRITRMHLEAEEFAEHMLAMIEGDEIEAFDGLLDLLYVAIGSAVVFDWPIAAGFEEVQRSNMTKAGRIGPRLRDKGNSYEPPELQRILAEHRDRFKSGLSGYIYMGNCDVGDCTNENRSMPEQLDGQSASKPV